ncbi:MAG: hypothetical protein ACYTKD_17520 [Planctomycetota bacterium]|jgi:hypothetical protein
MVRTMGLLFVLLALIGCAARPTPQNANARPGLATADEGAREMEFSKFGAASDSDSDESPLHISVRTGRPGYEVDQRTDHTLIVANESPKVLALPSFRFMNVKGMDPEFAFYVKEQILRIQVRRGSEVFPINEGWLVPPETPGQFPTVDLAPGETMRVPFSLTRQWYPSFYSLTAPGTYTVSVALDTTRSDNPRLLKGRFVSRPATFRIIPVGEFRARKAGESQQVYARARVAFYLERIAGHDGEHFPNVISILKTEGGVPALIEALDPGDDESARLARSILGQIHHPLGTPDPPAPPTSQDEWMKWWQTEGKRLPSRQLWGNFDSHYQ